MGHILSLHKHVDDSLNDQYQSGSAFSHISDDVVEYIEYLKEQHNNALLRIMELESEIIALKKEPIVDDF